MKKLTILLLMISITYLSIGQQTTNNTPPVTTDYLKKSKNQKTTAWVMLGGGSALLLTAAIIPRGELNNGGYGPGHKNDGLKSILGIGGFLSMASSTILFISSSKNKKKAMSMSFNSQPLPELHDSKFVFQTIPSLKLEISL